MKITFLPKTKLGKWSIILIIASIILFVIGSVLPSRIGPSVSENLINNPLQAIALVLIFASGISASVLGLISVIKKQERSILVFLVILSGLYNILNLIGVIVNLSAGTT